MAVKTATNYFSNAIVGQPSVGSDINIFEVNNNPKFPVGYGFERSDGSRFRYAQFGSTTNAGYLVSTFVSESTVSITGTNVVIQSDSATSVSGVPLKPGKIGSYYLEAYLTASKNQFAGGYLIVTGFEGRQAGTSGYTYRIKGNTAAATGGGTKCMLNLYEPLVTEVYTECNIGITSNRWVDLITATSGANASASVAGVVVNNVSATQYAWVQTKGICAALPSSQYAPVIGSMVGLDTAGNGKITACFFTTTAGLFGKPFVGFCVLTGSNGTHSAIALNIA